MDTLPRITKAEKREVNNKIRSRWLTGQQLAAIRLAAGIGNDIRKNYPDIAVEYRNLTTGPELVAKYGFDRRYGVSRQVAISAVRNAIRGYSGHFCKPYPGLIADRSEREHLSLAHNRRTGMEAYERKCGIHALNREQKAAAGRKGGLIQGPLSYRLRIGCHALSPEALREHCRRIAPIGGKAGGMASVVARGLVPFTPAASGRIGEIQFMLSLAADPRYLGPVRANFKKIAEKVNEIFHTGNLHHTRTTMKIALQSYRRRNRSASDSLVDLEMSFAEKLTLDPAYQLPARIKAVEIAHKVNEVYHDGRSLRNPLCICDAIQRYRRQGADATSADLSPGVERMVSVAPPLSAEEKKPHWCDSLRRSDGNGHANREGCQRGSSGRSVMGEAMVRF